MKIRSGAVVTGLVAIVAIGLMVGTFMANASPYVTYEEALKLEGRQGLHLSGDLVKESVHMDFKEHTVKFTLIDEKGKRVNVVHRGDPPANMGEATKVVAIGTVKDGVFESEKLLIKCPSKYEGVKQEKPA